MSATATIMKLTSRGQRYDALRCQEVDLVTDLTRLITQVALWTVILRVPHPATPDATLSPGHGDEVVRRGYRTIG